LPDAYVSLTTEIQARGLRRAARHRTATIKASNAVTIAAVIICAEVKRLVPTADTFASAGDDEFPTTAELFPRGFVF